MRISALQPVGSPCSRRLPDAVPIGVVALAAWIDEAVVSRTDRIDREHVTRTAVGKRPDDDADMILGIEHRVALHAEADDARRIGIVADDPDHDRVSIGEHFDSSVSRGRCAFNRIRLTEVFDRVDRFPCHLRQLPVDRDRAGQRANAERGSGILGRRRASEPGEDHCGADYGPTRHGEISGQLFSCSDAQALELSLWQPTQALGTLSRSLSDGMMNRNV